MKTVSRQTKREESTRTGHVLCRVLRAILWITIYIPVQFGRFESHEIALDRRLDGPIQCLDGDEERYGQTKRTIISCATMDGRP